MRQHGESGCVAEQAIEGGVDRPGTRLRRHAGGEGRDLGLRLRPERRAARLIDFTPRGGEELAIQRRQAVDQRGPGVAANLFGGRAQPSQLPDRLVQPAIEGG